MIDMPSGKKAKAKRREQRAYKQALATQLRYIDRSCQFFDQGHWDEAIRIATQLRVVMHQGGGKTKSLFQHLGAVKSVKLLSTVHPVSETAIMFQGMGCFTYSSDGEEVSMSFHPSLGDVHYAAEMRFHDWWEQIVWVDSPINQPKVVLRRKDIILTAANKDGGAHFDDLTPEYERLAAPGAAGSFAYTVGGVEHSMPIAGAHFVCLRQMGYEILHSPEVGMLLNEAA